MPKGSHVPAILAAAVVLVAAAPPTRQTVPTSGSTPTRIILTWADDPAHTQAVTWRTDVAAATPQVQIAKTTSDPAFEASANSVAATAAQDDLPDGRHATHYAARLTGLEPSTRYCYRVGDGRNWSEWNVFRTAAADPEPFEFLYLGDAQNSIRSLWSRTIRAAFSAAPGARFIVHAGDLLAEGYDDRLWEEWTGAMGFISATMPSLPAPGNHDLHRPPNSPDPKQVLSASPLWRAHFLLPPNGPEVEELRSQAYFLDYQGVRFVVLDVNPFANEDFVPAQRSRVQQAEVRWLEHVLSNNPNRWTIVVQHQPCYPTAKGRDYPEIRTRLVPLYDKYGVDLVLQGHDHMYARSMNLRGGKPAPAGARGIIYTISVSGPKMYKTESTHVALMAKIIENRQLFQRIEVNPGQLRFTAYTLDGAVADQFEIKK